MQFQIDQFETYAGVLLQPDRAPLTDEEFFAICEKYPDYRIETTAGGDILVMPPAHLRTGHRNAAITTALYIWAQADGRGRVFDSSTGFFLKNGARRSADSSWVSNDRLQSWPDGYALWHTTPNFIVELKSASDRSNTLRAKMREWIANGVSLGWLILPETRAVEIYRADGSVEELANAPEIKGEGPVAGFTLPLAPIWE